MINLIDNKKKNIEDNKPKTIVEKDFISNEMWFVAYRNLKINLPIVWWLQTEWRANNI
jgi:hypothetical protein